LEGEIKKKKKKNCREEIEKGLEEIRSKKCRQQNKILRKDK